MTRLWYYSLGLPSGVCMTQGDVIGKKVFTSHILPSHLHWELGENVFLTEKEAWQHHLNNLRHRILAAEIEYDKFRTEYVQREREGFCN